MEKSIASNALTGFVLILFLLAGLVGWAVSQWRDPGPLTQAICLEVPPAPEGSLLSVSQDLSDQGAIRSAAIFRAGADSAMQRGTFGALKAGSFLVEAGASMEDIAQQITGSGVSTCGTEIVWRVGVTRTTAQIRELDPASGRYEERARWIPDAEPTPAAYDDFAQRPDTQLRLVVAEGVTSWQVRAALNAIDLLEGDVSETPPEGMLAPDSYAFVAGDSAEAVIARMRAAQEARLAEIWAGRSDNAMVSTPEEALILASIIEKETGLPQERRQVAAVFSNRLRDGMRLQTDPTVIYGITRGEGVLGRGIRQSELERETPWNTYVISGLPPTPIANPGLEALRAAVDPGDEDYLFFVADGTGGHAFATTLADHQRNTARWREIEAARAAEGGGN